MLENPLKRNWHFRQPVAKDVPALTHIYNYYVTDTVFTLEYEAITQDEMSSRLANILALGYLLLVEQQQTGEILGFTYAKPWNERIGFRFTFESTIYLKHDRDMSLSKGLGTLLYQQLLEQIKASAMVRVLLGVIVSGNGASIALHQKLGFRKIATFPQVGIKFDRSLDIEYWAHYFDELGINSAG